MPPWQHPVLGEMVLNFGKGSPEDIFPSMPKSLTRLDLISFMLVLSGVASRKIRKFRRRLDRQRK